MSSEHPFNAVLVGCGGMGRNQTRILSEHPDFTITAVADIQLEMAESVAEEFGIRAYGDFVEMLDQEQPEVVAIPTSNKAHAPLTLLAAKCPSVKAIYCEKPMAISMHEATDMVAACEAAGIELIINHQRRLGNDVRTAKRLIDEGAIGKVRTLRGCCAGDTLSDGTHVVDSLLYLLGDPKMSWIMGQIVRDIDALEMKWARMGREVPPEGVGFRYGHPVESGAMAVAEVETGERLELFFGDLRYESRIYQDYLIEGDAGTIWRLPDSNMPNNLFICDGKGGDHVCDRLKGHYIPVPAEDGKGPWRQISAGDGIEWKKGIKEGYRLLADTLRNGTPHPMRAQVAIRGFEIVMGIYESARLGKRLTPPVIADEFPLITMLREAEGKPVPA